MGKYMDAVKRFFMPTRAKFGSYNIIDAAMVKGLGIGDGVGREAALGITVVSGGLKEICGDIGQLPLATYGRNNVEMRSMFLERINPAIPNIVTISQTVEDLVLNGESWWRITDFYENGFPKYAYHVDIGTVSLNPPSDALPSTAPSGEYAASGVIWINGEEVPESQVIRFPSPFPGLLTSCAKPIRRLHIIQAVAEMYAKNPRPLDYFTPKDDADPLDDDGIKELLANWTKRRQKGATAYVPAALEYNTVDSLSPADLQLNDLIRQCTLDIISAMRLDPEDYGISTTSRVYQNDTDRRKEKLIRLGPYMHAISERLSYPDVTPNGQTVRFNTKEFLQADPKTQAEVAQIYVQLGIKTVEEVRAELGLPNMPEIGTLRKPIQATVGDPVQDNSPLEIESAS